MSSQFDALLDFGDDPPPSTNGTAQQANGGDEFDPFGPGPLDSGKGGGSDEGLLLDFSMSTEVSSSAKNGTSSDPFDTQFSLTTDTDSNLNSNAATNPFADMSSTEPHPSVNPLYNLMDEDLNQPEPAEPSSANPLYDLSNDNTTSDMTFETNVTTTTTVEESSANPLYDLMDQEEETVTKTETTASADLLGMDFGSGMGEEKSTPSEDVLVQANNNYMDDQVVPDLAAEQESTPREEEEEEEAAESFDQNVELFIREEGEDQRPAAAVEETAGGLEAGVDVEQQQQQQQEEEVEEAQKEEVEEAQKEEAQKEEVDGGARSRSRSPSRHSISSEGEVINEEEEMRQDERLSREAQQPFEESRSEEEQTQISDTAFGGADQPQDYGVEDGNIVREQEEKEDFHFQEMSSVKNQFEQGPEETAPQQQQPIDIRQEVSSTEGGINESEPATSEPQWEEEPEEGIYENEPEQRSDVVRESDRNIGAELPSVGTAKSMRDKFVSGQVEKSAEMKKEATPTAATDGGVFENEPQYNADVIHAGDQSEEALPEQGTARNLAARFKELEKQGGGPAPSPGKREITPDRTGKVEYVSEPRGHVDKYEPEVQAGVFESQPAEREDVVKSDQAPEEILPEKGSAKNIAARFKQMSTDNTSKVPREKREITPDTSGRVEYTSEPTGFVEKYEGCTESGVFESQPADREDVVKSDIAAEEVMPERGTAKNIAARFKQMEKTTKSPPSPSKVKEFTPPRENGTGPQSSGVYESTPQVSKDVVHSDEQQEEVLPEKGMAKSIANRFRQLSTGESTPTKSPRSKKEFTPPPGGSGVYENTPKQFVPDYNQPAESGILESKPETRSDVVRSEDPNNSEQELPEQGYTKNLLSAWRQKESESSKVSPPSSDKPKEFTPPREEPRVTQQRPAPRTPKSPLAGTDMNDGSVHPSDLPGQYQPQAEASVFESEPERRQDVVREDDTDWTQGMPKPDTTKKMLAKFRNIQQQAGVADGAPAKPKPTARKEGEDKNSRESTPDKVGRSKSMRVPVQLEKCGACQKTVYAMEKIEIEKHSYHKSCFRCSHCHCILTPKTFAINKNVMFCTNHYKQLFATKGNYDEGFGRDQHKKRWKSEPNLADEEHYSTASAHH